MVFFELEIIPFILRILSSLLRSIYPHMYSSRRAARLKTLAMSRHRTKLKGILQGLPYLDQGKELNGKESSNL